jgi:hypothetical protein
MLLQVNARRVAEYLEDQRGAQWLVVSHKPQVRAGRGIMPRAFLLGNIGRGAGARAIATGLMHATAVSNALALPMQVYEHADCLVGVYARGDGSSDAVTFHPNNANTLSH